MTTGSCGVAALLRAGGPVRVPLRECCVAALVGADGVITSCAATPDPAATGAIDSGLPRWEPIEVSP